MRKKATKQLKLKAKSSKNVQKLGLVLGALESQIAPGTQVRPITCIRIYCEPN